MTDDERQRIIEEARATLDRTASVRVEPRNPLSESSSWQLPQPEPRRRQRGLDTDICRLIDQRIAAALKQHEMFQRSVLAEHDRIRREALVQFVCDRLKQLRDELRAEIDGLRADQQQAHESITELPPFLPRSPRRAA